MNGFKDQVEFAEQRSGDVVLRSDINQQYLQVTSGVDDGSCRGHQLEEFFRHVDLVALIYACLSIHVRRQEPTLHGPFLSQLSCQRTGVDSGDARYLFTVEPFGKRAGCRMMAISIDQVLNHQALYLNAGGFEWRVQAACGSGCRHTIISNEWIRQYEYLAPVGRIRYGLDVAGHAGVEDDLAGDRPGYTG